MSNAPPRPGELRRLCDRALTLARMLAIRPLRRRPYPFYVNLVINSRCSLRCSYCFGRYGERGHADMPLASFTALVDGLHRRGTRFVVVQGGEPLLHPDLGAMLVHLHRRGIVSGISTNGQHPELLARIPELQLLDNICFSLDGAPAGNDRVRGAGCFARVSESIDAVRRLYPRLPVRINTTLHRHVMDDAPFLAEFTRARGIEWGVAFLFLGTESLAGEPLAPGPEQLRAYLELLLDYKRRGYPIFTSSRAIRYALTWPEYAVRHLDAAGARARLSVPPIRCQYGRYEIVIDEDGRVLPCNALQEGFAAGTLARDGFDAAFARLAAKPCYTCPALPLINTSAMLNWDWRVIVETVAGHLRHRLRVRRPPSGA